MEFKGVPKDCRGVAGDLRGLEETRGVLKRLEAILRIQGCSRSFQKFLSGFNGYCRTF